MKHLIIPLLLLGGFVALMTTEANAVVCARGVHRAHCVNAHAQVAARPASVHHTRTYGEQLGQIGQ
jgi:hypothetical protein